MKLHASKVIKRPEYTKTTTLCGRSRTTSDGMNIADDVKKVTCKFCLKMLAAHDAGGV